MKCLITFTTLSYGRSSTFFVNFFTECNTFLLVYGSRVSDKIIISAQYLLGKVIAFSLLSLISFQRSVIV